MLDKIKSINNHSAIRVLLALFTLIRAVQVVYSFYVYQNYQLIFEEWFYTVTILALNLAFLFNYKTYIVCSLLLFLNYKFDLVFFCPGLSTSIAAFLLIYYGLCDFAVKRGLDIFNSEKNILYQIKWIVFIPFATINLLSAVHHFQNAYWHNGTALEGIATNAFFGRSPIFFRNHLSIFWKYFFMVSTYGLMLTQTVLFLWYLFKPLRKYIHIWFILLIIWTFFILQISWLMYILLFYYLAIFNKGLTSFDWKKIVLFKNYPSFLKPIYILICVFCGAIVFFKMPGVSKMGDKAVWLFREWDTRKYVLNKIAIFGIHSPDIFNENHITGGQKWFVLYRIDENGKKLVPIMDTNGCRMHYYKINILRLQNHGSEFLYIGNSGQFAFGNDTITYNNNSTPYKFKGSAMDRMIRFDYFFHKYHTDKKYEIVIYQRKFPNKNGKLSSNYASEITNSYFININPKGEIKTIE